MSEQLTAEQQRMVEENIRLAYMMSYKHMRPYGMDFDDWQAECMALLAKAVRIYDPSKGKLASFLDKFVVNTRSHLNKRNRRVKRGYGVSTLSSDHTYQMDCALSDFFGKEHDWDTIDNQELCKSALSHLTEREMVAFRMLSEGCSRQEIGEHFGVTRSRASQLIARAREKLAKKFPELLVNSGQCICCGKARQQYSHVTTSYCTDCTEALRSQRDLANQKIRRRRKAQAASA